jgi:putative ABC transport system permease protein
MTMVSPVPRTAAGMAHPRALPLGLRMLGREWRSGELGVLLLALIVAVAALTGVGFLVSRISNAVASQASEVLAADIRLGSPQPIKQGVCRRSGGVDCAPRGAPRS